MPHELSRIIHQMVLESRTAPKELAEYMEKPYSTLLREVNPNDAGAKLGIETFFQLIKLTGDTTALSYMAHELGLKLVGESTNSTS